jgi:hypothetical protein
LGCASSIPDRKIAVRLYEGDPKPPAEVAVLKGWLDGIATLTGIEDVDGKRLKDRDSSCVEVLPGEHTVKVWATISPDIYHTYNGAAKVRFSAEAGHTYLVTAATNVLPTRDPETRKIIFGLTGTDAKWAPVIRDITSCEENARLVKKKVLPRDAYSAPTVNVKYIEK